ncbi:MAG: DUF4270 family protein [Bacteroidia bacterium]|nr:DUF4270 family protein [Bacteroidia bacterium]
MKKTIAFILFFSYLAIALFSCKKENSLGLPVSPSPSFVISGKTGFRATAITMGIDSVLTDEVSSQLLGCVHDPILGISYASFANQFYLDNSAVDFGPNCTLDSLVVSYAFTSFPNYYGNIDSTNGKLKIKVFELTSAISYDKTYYSNYNITSLYNPLNPVAQLTTYLKPNYIPTTEEANPSPQLRIRLSDNLGNLILNSSVSGTNQLSDNATFQNFFKGLYVAAENPGLSPGQGAIAYFNLNNPSSKLTLYYKDQTGAHKNFSFGIKETAAHFNMFKHNRAGFDTYNQLNGLTTDTSRIYVQGMGGLKTKINLPFLDMFKDSGNIAINKCEIEFFIEPNLSTNTFPAFDQLYLTGIDSVGNVFILDDQTNGLDFGGSVNTTRGSYKFNISRYAQQVISKQKHNFGLYLVGGSSGTTATRVILKGKENILVTLNYTKF